MIVVSNCSATKRAAPATGLRAGVIRLSSIDHFAAEWVERVRAAPACGRGVEVYGGAAVTAARQATAILEAQLYFVSAGMGVVGPRRKIPAYDLTVSPGPSAPLPLRSGRASSRTWWTALNRAWQRPTPLAAIVRGHDDLIFVALPDSYMRMVGHELALLSKEHRRKLRVVVAHGTAVPPELADSTLTFDQRLRGLPGVGGAQCSFAQRALLMLARALDDRPRCRSVHAQRGLIESALEHALPSSPPSRSKISEAILTTWLAQTEYVGRPTTTLLRELRNAGFACGSQRFARAHECFLASSEVAH